MGTNPANGKRFCYRVLHFHYSPSQPAVTAIEMLATRSGAGCRKAEHFRGTHRRRYGKQFCRHGFRMRQMSHARLLDRAQDDSQDHASLHGGLSAWTQSCSLACCCGRWHIFCGTRAKRYASGFLRCDGLALFRRGLRYDADDNAWRSERRTLSRSGALGLNGAENGLSRAFDESIEGNASWRQGLWIQGWNVWHKSMSLVVNV